jgi:hypothetical protein
MEKNAMEQNKDYSIIFKRLNEEKQKIDFRFLEETMEQSNVIWKSKNYGV